MKGAGATQSSGRSQGVVGVTPTGIELGLGVGGIGQLGISTDYGGGIVVAIFGQKIVWGREGGKIHYNFGVFEVLVEAINCIVTETHKISGQVVRIHVYPDPGCKPEPKPPDPNLPVPVPVPTPGVEGEIELPDIDQEGWIPFSERIDYYVNGQIHTTVVVNRKATDINKERRAISLPYTSLSNSSHPRIYNEDPVILKGTRLTSSAFTITKFDGSGIISVPFLGVFSARSGARVCFYGLARIIKKLIADHNAENEKYRSLGSINGPIRTLIPTGFIPLKQYVSPPSAGNQPPMPESCCESLSADIADLKEVLACKEMLAGKLTFPWKWRMPGGEGEEIITDYANLLRAQSQQIDHLGIHPPKLTVKDINNAIAGDQGLTNQFPSATQAFEALMAQIWDANGDIDTLTNFLYRLAWLCVQQSFNLAQLTGSVESLKDMIGGETEPLETELTTPFNIAAGTELKKAPSGKGFGKSAGGSSGSIDNRIDANTEMSTEKMLPEFLKIRENPILVDTFSGKQDIFDLLRLIQANLEKLNNK